MFKKLTALFLCAIMVMGLVPMSAQATDTVTVSVSFSMYGKLLEDKNGETIANREIVLTSDATVNDALYELHRLYCPDGADAYGTGTSDWGAYITRLWGDESTKFGYQVNGGAVSTTLDTPMIDGDRLDACIYYNYYPDTEAYTTFDIISKTVYEGESLELTLSAAGYDENYNMIFSPLEGAKVTIDGEETDIITDAEGKAEIEALNAGEYIISAKMDKTLIKKDENGEVIGEEIVPAITAPVCTLTVKMLPENELLHGIAGKYSEDGILDSGSNFPWIVSDLAVYNSLYGGIFTKKLKQTYLDKLISDAVSMESPGDLSKTIIAISALGYDASVVYTKTGAELKLVEKLTALVDAKDESVTNMYTLPYVIIALNQGDYATDEQINYLVNSAISTKEDWLKVEDMGTDAMTPMILALAPYSDAQGVIEEAVAILKRELREDGLINGFPGYESASSALAICGLSAIGTDSSEFTNGGKNLVEGLISDANEDLSALSNAFATEQGFRALLSLKMLGSSIYDFSDYPKEEARATRVTVGGGGGGGGSTKPSVKPEEPKEEIEEEAKEEPEISFPDVKAGDWYYEAVSFVCEKGLFNGTTKGFEPNGKMTRAMLVTVLYRMSGETSSESSAFTDVKADAWYCDAVNWASENGIVNGTSATTFAPDENVTREQLATILYRFAKARGEDVEGSDLSGFNDADTVSDYAKDAFSYATEKGIITGKGEGILAPQESATRAQVATMLMRYVLK